ncbi:MAG: hypothetical protein R3C39_16285 [Dehalococcoidia bacterium]
MAAGPPPEATTPSPTPEIGLPLAPTPTPPPPAAPTPPPPTPAPTLVSPAPHPPEAGYGTLATEDASSGLPVVPLLALGITVGFIAAAERLRRGPR